MPFSSALGSNALNPAGFGFRNLIINGDMSISQRGTSYSSGSYTVDRWFYGKFGGSALTATQSTDAPAGFARSFRFTSTFGFNAGNQSFTSLEQRIEGLNTAFLGYGTATAKQTTLSFWVRSSFTGLHSVCFANSANDRKYIATYTIGAANTWEQKIISLPGDVTGTWLTDNTIGLRVIFVAQAGDNERTTTVNQWFTDSSSGNAKIAATGTVDPLSVTGNIFAVTGVQLEQNNAPTNFEYRPIGLELSLCQRYFEIGRLVSAGYGSVATVDSGAYSSASFAVRKRATPSITEISKTLLGSPAGYSSGTTYIDAQSFGYRYHHGGSSGSGNLYFDLTWSASIEL